MTQPINTFQDILDALEQNPTLAQQLRQHLLTEDLLKLPAVVGELQEGEGPITNQVRNLSATVGHLEEGEAPVTTQLRDIKVDITSIKDEMTTMGKNVSSITTRIDKMGGDVSRLDGKQYEDNTAAKGDRRIRSRFQFLDASLLYHDRNKGIDELRELVQPALEQGVFTTKDRDDLEDADLIFRGQTSPGPDSLVKYVVTEVSITIEEDDVVRARHRAAIMNAVPGINAVAAVIGTAITPEALQALGSDVTAIGMDEEGRECPLADTPSERDHISQEPPRA